MDEPTDLVVGNILIDNLLYADGSRRENVIGGAGLYALAGAALWSSRALLVTGAGEDVSETFGPWMSCNGLSRRGLRIADPFTPRNILRYLDERTRTEMPVFGDEHFERMRPTAADIGKVIDGARSLYLFRNTEAAVWDGVAELKRHRPFTLFWEIALDACTPAERGRIESLLEIVDGFSLNLDEAALIFGVSDEEKLICIVQGLAAGCTFLRAGSRGSFAVTPDDVRFVPSLPVDPVDVTGGGNAYCGGAMIGLAEGRSPLVAAAMGTVSATFAIRQFGPPEAGDPALQAEALRSLSTLTSPLLEGQKT